MDIEADKAVADAQLQRALMRKTRLDSQEITSQVAQMIAYDQGDLTTEQYELLQKQQAIIDQTPTVSDVSPQEDDLLTEGAQPTAQTGDSGGDETAVEGAKDVKPPKARTAVEDDVKTAIESTFETLYHHLLGKTDATDPESN